MKNVVHVELTLPLPPTLNHAIGVQGKRRFLSGEYKSFLWRVAELWAKANPKGWRTDARYSVAIFLVFPDRRKRDLDNRVKPLLDALTRVGVWKDDSQVDEILVVRGTNDKDRPRATVRIKRIESKGA